MKKFTMKFALLLFLVGFFSATAWADDWTENFNDQTSNTYNTLSYTINGRVWTCSNAGNFSYGNTTMGSPAFVINDDKPDASITTPVLNTCGAVSFQYAYKSGDETNVFVLQKSTDNINWTDLDTHTLGAASNLAYIDYSYDVNEVSATTYIRVLSDAQNAHLFVDNFTVTNYVPAADPIITNIIQNPDADITSATTVSVSADVTAVAGVAGVELHWGTATGVFGNTIDMTNVGDTYTTDTDIPAQADGTTIYYEVYALDNNLDDNTSAEQSYTVADPDPLALYVVGSFNAWTQLEAYKMTLGADGIYTCTVDIPAGDDQEYKVRKGDDYSPGANNYTISLASETSVTFYANPTLMAYHISPKISGDFIDQLGGVNWTPEDAAGTMAGPDAAGVFTFSGYLTAGDYAFKVTFNDAWTNATPDANYEFNHAAAGYVVITYDFPNNTIAVAEPTWTVPFSEDFETVAADSDISLTGWVNANYNDEDLVWIGKEFAANKYAQVSSYGSAFDEDQLALITPPINMDNTDNEMFSFDVNVGYWKHDGLAVYVSTDYDQTVAGIGTATWIDITDQFTIPQEPAGGYGVFATAGTTDLSAYAGTLNIAFAYDGDVDEGETTTYQIDNVQIKAYTTATWTGATDNNWKDAGNWDTAEFPDGENWNVVIPAGLVNYPTVTEGVMVNNIDLEEGATLLGTSHLMMEGTLTTKRHVQWYDQYHYLTSPVGTIAIEDAFPNGSVGAAFYMYSYNEPTQMWDAMAREDDMEAGVGYNIYRDAGAGLDFDITFSTTVMVAEGYNYMNLSYSAAAGNENYESWHLLGNPCVAAFDWDLKNDISGMQDAVYTWDGVAQNYVSWTAGAGALSDGIVPLGQGYMVKVTSGTNSLNTNGGLVHSSTGMYKSSANALRLDVTSTENSFEDATFVRFVDGNEADYSADKLFGSEKAPQLYTVENEEEYSINAINEEVEAVALNFRAGEATTYTLTVAEMLNNATATLEDLQTGETVELDAAATYTFDATTTDDAERFVLHIKAANGIGEQAASDVNIYAFADRVYVDAQTSGEAMIYNVAGQLVRRVTVTKGLNSVALESGIYIVRLGTEAQKVNVQ